MNLRPCLNLQSSDALNRVGANSSTSQLREGTALLSSSRRTFLQSLSKSALVLSLDSVLALARPLRPRALLSRGAKNRAKPAHWPGTELYQRRARVRAQRKNHLRRRTQEQISAGDHRLRRRLLRLRQRRLAGYFSGQRLAAGGFPCRTGTHLPSVQEQSRRHFHRRHRESRRGALRLGTGRLHRRL